jgi:hypothetical protein
VGEKRLKEEVKGKPAKRKHAVSTLNIGGR